MAGQRVVLRAAQMADRRVDLLAGKMADYSAAKRVVQKAVQWAEQLAALKVAQSVGHSAAQRVVLMVEPSDALMVERRAGLLAGQMADPTVVTRAGYWALHLVDQMAAHSVDL